MISDLNLEKTELNILIVVALDRSIHKMNFKRSFEKKKKCYFNYGSY